MSNVTSTRNRPTVLLIEPHRDSASMYAEVLEHAGYRVENTAAVDDGFQPATANLIPDVVIVSVRQCSPKPTLHVFAGGHEVPTIALTSDGRDADRAGRLEYAAVLVKPVAPETLIREVQRLITAKRTVTSH